MKYLKHYYPILYAAICGCLPVAIGLLAVYSAFIGHVTIAVLLQFLSLQMMSLVEN